MKLGDKVICYKKVAKAKNIPYVYQYKEKYLEEKEQGNLKENDICWEDTNDDVLVPTKEIIDIKPTEGIVVGKAEVSMANYFSYGYYGPSAEECMEIEKVNYIKCYKVYYSLNHSILVPIEGVVKINDLSNLR